ncbi:MAG: glycosyltransferase family 1 protein [Ferruginibacter sp.]
MIIAINSVSLSKSDSNDVFYNYFFTAAATHPEHQFIFIARALITAGTNTSDNINYVVSSPAASNSLVWKIWLDYTLPGIAKKHKVDIIINTSGLCSLRTKIPQCLFISDLSYLNLPGYVSKMQLHFLKKNMPAFIKKANVIVTASEFLTKDITRHYLTGEKKISTLQLIAGDDYLPIDWKEKEAVKEKYTEGKEYFLFNGEIHEKNNLLNLLKAFSFFKKRQKSNMQLVIAASAVSTDEPFVKDLQTYKFRKEVILLTALPAKELAKITAAAYASVYPGIHDGTGLSSLQAMQSGVPVITGNAGAIKQIAGDAALYVDPSNFEDIAAKMMLLFKDETWRSELINKGRRLIQQVKESGAEETFWKSLATIK